MGQEGSKGKAPTTSSSGGTTNMQNNNNNTAVVTSPPPPPAVAASPTGGEGGPPRADADAPLAEGTPRDDPVLLAERKLSNLRQDAMFQSSTQDDNAGDAKAAVESDEEEADFSFNFNSESSDEEIKFPTSAALLIPSIEISDPFVDLDTSTKRVAKDFIGSDA